MSPDADIYSQIFELYDRKAPAFITGNAAVFGEVVQRVAMHELAGKQPRLMIDLGMGGGGFAPFLLNSFTGDYAGVDGSAAMVVNAAHQLQPYGSRVNLHAGNYRDEQSAHLQELHGKGDLVISIGAGDGEPSYWEHMHDLAMYAAPDAVVIDMQYYKGNQTGRGSEKIAKSELTAYKDLRTGLGLSEMPPVRSLMNMNTMRFVGLVLDRAFKRHDRNVAKPALADIRDFAQEAGVPLTIVQSSSFRPTLLAFRMTEGIRELIAARRR